ncbi:MAG: hypothetical protein LQ343_002906 [Gyalolechia ehrenbergii]|nr:MAG: hypothetical protein LQ343_002906 [Gyalolechia ehrenbergii]
MALPTSKKRKHESLTKPKALRPLKKFKKQTHYSSSSSSTSADEKSDFPAVNLEDGSSDTDQEETNAEDSLKDNPQNDNARLAHNKKQSPSSPSSPSASDSESLSSASHTSPSNSQPKPKSRPTSKRNDPTAFATSISSILTTKLPTATRTDPVLARSSSAHAVNTEIREALLEKRARQQLRAEKKALLEKGRVKDVLLGTAIGENAEEQREEGAAGKVMEEEKRLKKTAQRGVVKLFNAVRMAQVRGEEAKKEAVAKGVVGAKRREEKVGEMSKKGFLELVASGGGKGREKGEVKGDKMSGEGIKEA